MQNTVIPHGANSHFARIPGEHIERSTFDRSHSYSTTFDENVLVPIFCDEVLPGDVFELNSSLLCRLATPRFPFMDNLQLDMHFFFVPNRLVWQNWKAFCGEKSPANVDKNYLIPQVAVDPTKELEQSIYDYFGLPIYAKNKFNVNALPFRAYNLIWNEWYRDENLQDYVDVQTGDTDTTTYKLLPRNKRKDYFTSALPWPQKGTESSLPARVIGDPATFLNQQVYLGYYSTDGTRRGLTPEQLGSYGVVPNNLDGRLYDIDKNKGLVLTQTINPNDFNLRFVDSTGQVKGGLSINDLRQAIAIQHFLELNARGGTRYVELLLSHFGVVSSDARLQRPEFLGQARFDLNVSPVVQNSATDETSPQGNLSAFAMAGGMQNIFDHSFEEHGYIIGLASIRSDLTYQQGLKKMWSRRDLYDFAFPQFAHLGEQAILNKEIYTQGTEEDEQVFGYQERYAEYRYNQGQITGKLRSDAQQSLDVWHLAQDFTELPKLNSDFIKEQIPVDRVIAIPSEPHFIANIWFDMKCSRPLPTYSIPGLETI